MAEITGGELILRCLVKEGVKRIYGITDSGYHPLMGAVEKYGVRWVAPRHEAAAAHMAEGEFKTTGNVPVVMAGGGPGTANLISGIICARAEGIPIIAISAQRRSGVVYPARSGVYQSLDQQDLFRPVTKWNAAVHAWERIPEIIQTAYREAVCGRPGPVHIDVPDDIMYLAKDEDSVRLLEPSQYRATVPEPSERQIDEAARMIAEAENPLLIAGTGVLNAGAWDDFLEMVELLNCPATCTAAANSAMPHGHPNYLRVFGAGAFQARREADVILAVGTRLGELDLPFDKYFGDPAKQRLIQVDVDPRNIGANRPIAMGIVADAKLTTAALVIRLKALKIEPGDGESVKKCKKTEDEWWAGESAAARDYQGDKIHPAKSVEIAREIFSPNATCVSDGGNTSLFSAFYAPLTKPRTALGITEFGHLGTGIPMAIGAKLADPKRDVYVITGDGAAGFNFMEMETAAREQVKITVIVHAEESWCMEEIEQIFNFGDPSKVVACAQMPVRWDKTAESLGCHGEYVDKAEDLADALRRAKDSPLPAVVCVKTDKEANLIPPAALLFGEVYTGPTEE